MISLEEGLITETLQVLTFWGYAVQLFCEPNNSKQAASQLQSNTAPRKPAKEEEKAEPEKAESESEPEKEEKEKGNKAKSSKGNLCASKASAPTGGSESSKQTKRPAKSEENRDSRTTRLDAGFNPVPICGAPDKERNHSRLPEPQRQEHHAEELQLARVGGEQLKIPTFETWLSARMPEYLKLLDDLPSETVDELTERALLHVSTLNLGAHAFDAVKGFFQRRDLYPPVRLMVAEDNEAVLKSLAKGRCPKLRHVARTHRVNLDWCYDLFRRPEIEATYV